MYVCHVCHDVCGVCGEDRQVVTVKINHFVDLNQHAIHPPAPRCPPLCVFQIRTVRRRLVSSPENPDGLNLGMHTFV